MYKKLYKVRYGAKVDGVCGGLANYLDMDPTVMRIIWIVGSLFLNVGGIIAYIVCSLVMPREPQYFDNNEFGHSGNYNNYQNPHDNNRNR